MSVVAGENPEVVLALEGGSTFDSRLNELRRATAIYNDAVRDLRLGQEAQAAWAKALADRDAAKALLEAAKVEADAIVERAKVDAKDIRDRARANGDKAVEARKQAEEALAQALADRDAVAVAKGLAQAEADAILSRATARAEAMQKEIDASSAAIAKREAIVDDKAEKTKAFIAGVKALVKDLK
jgi:hypothetical protein